VFIIFFNYNLRVFFCIFVYLFVYLFLFKYILKCCVYATCIQLSDNILFLIVFSTFRYDMIFVPFTGVDHHKKCVTFGAALLYDEKVDTYKLLLETFLKAHKKQPRLVLTDQDAAMKNAVSIVFTESVHRLCMWHIMDKLPSKVYDVPIHYV
jgi:hypothetical protein